MAKTLTFAGENILRQYKTNSAKIRETIQNKSNVMTLDIVVKPNETTPQQGSEVVFKDDDRFLFGGYISRVNPKEIGKGQMFIYGVEVSDYSYILNNKIARRAYQNKTLKFIVEDLLDAYLDASYGFDTSNVATGPTLATVTFDHISLRKCFEKLQKLTGYVWYVDYEKNVFWHAPSAVAAPETITDDSDNYETINISYDASQVRNSVIVIGNVDGEQDSNTTVETFTGDGETRAWELQSKPSEIVSIKINGGAPEQFSLDVNERDTDVFVYSFEGQSFRLTNGQPTPAGPTPGPADEIEITYYGRVPIIAIEIDPESIAFFANLDGGDGHYEYTIKDPTVTSKDEASERALQELAEFSMPLVNGQLVTRTTLLEFGSVFSPGQYLTVNLPTHGILADTAFLIQEVNISLNENAADNTTEYIYTIRFGGKLVGVTEFLESLASDEGEVSDAEIIITLESTSDAFEVGDSDLDNDLFTPPFEYGPAGSPQGRWNMSQWS